MKPCLRRRRFGNQTIVLGARLRLLLALPASILLPVLILAQLHSPVLNPAHIPELLIKLALAIAFGAVLWFRVPTAVAIIGPSGVRTGPHFAHMVKSSDIEGLAAKDVRDPTYGKLLGWHITATLKGQTFGKEGRSAHVLILVVNCPDPVDHVVSVLRELAAQLNCGFELPIRTGAPEVLREIRRIDALRDLEVPGTSSEGTQPVSLRRDLTGVLFGNPLSLPLLAAGISTAIWSAASFSIPKLLLAILVFGVLTIQARPPVELTDQALKVGLLRRRQRWPRSAVLMATEGRMHWMGAPVRGIDVFLRNGEREELPGSALLSSRRTSQWIAAIDHWCGHPPRSTDERNSLLNRFLTGSDNDPAEK